MTRKLAALLMVFLLLGAMTASAAAQNTNSRVQIVQYGASVPATGADPVNGQALAEGSLNEDGVRIKKSITPTANENYFDIDLDVWTTEDVQTLYVPKDLAVVIVMDMSFTMVHDENGQTINNQFYTRYGIAKEAADTFIDQFCESAADSSASRQLAVVRFNTDAKTIKVDKKRWTDCKVSGNADKIKKALKDEANSVFMANEDGVLDPEHGRYTTDAPYYSNSDYYTKLYTNIEGGLQLAHNLLAQRPEENKYIILLTDGLPTTYISGNRKGLDSISGYNPRMDCNGNVEDTSKIGEDGYFYDAKTRKWCKYGTSYSDKGAIRARGTAAVIKNSGTPILSIGCGISNTNLDTIQSMTRDKEFSVVDTAQADDTNLEVFKPSLFPGNQPQAEGAFEKWLAYTIGSRFYRRGDDIDSLEKAFKDILSKVDPVEHATDIAVNWVTNDMLNQRTPEHIEFMNFYTKGNQSAQSLSGEAGAGKENTASYSASSDTIVWDLKRSGHEVISPSSGETIYHYNVRYRVRLKNELVKNGAPDFSENGTYATNGQTSLRYQVRIDGVLGDSVSVNYPIPAVKGYLADLTFTKKSARPVDQDEPVNLQGAQFTLTHAQNCPVCAAARGSNNPVSIPAMSATSGEDGTVTFNNVPSGHSYTLTESSAPHGHQKPSVAYTVTVAYDKLTHNITGGSVVNMQQVMPATWQPVVKKHVDNAAQQQAGVFSFTLTGPDGYSQTVSNDAYGEVVFPQFSYDRSGVYTYTIKENKGDNPYVSYDGTVFTVKVTVSGQNVGSGATPGRYVLTANAEVSGGNDQTVLFSNIYLKDILLTKYSRDFGTLLPGAEFTLSHTSACCGEYIAPQTVTTGKDGTCTFKALQVTHSYVLTETKAPKNYLKPDSQWKLSFVRAGDSTTNGVYSLQVTGGNGEVVTDGISADGNTLKLKATDTEKYPKDAFAIEMKKLLDGHAVQQDENGAFAFNVYYAASAKDAPRLVISEMENLGTVVNQNDRVVFDPQDSEDVHGDPRALTFTHEHIWEEAGDLRYFYLFKETDGGSAVIDNSLYGARLTVVAEGGSETAQGSLAAQIDYFRIKDGELVYLGAEDAQSAVPAFDNTSLLDLRLVKFDPTNNRLTGAKFVLKHDPACPGCEETRIEPIVSVEESEGTHWLRNVYAGHDYLLTETKAPEYHLRPKTPWKLRVTASGYKQFELTLEEGDNLIVTDAKADGENRTLGIEVHNPQMYPAIEVKLSAKKLYDDRIPPLDKVYAFRLYAVDEKPVESEAFDLDAYKAKAELLEVAANVGGDIDFTTTLRFTHHDIYEDHGGKEFYFLMDERLDKGRGTVHDDTLYLIVVRIHAQGGDEFTPGNLAAQIQVFEVKQTGALDAAHTAKTNALYEKASGVKLETPTAVFRNNHPPELPPTGDRSNMALYALLLIGSACCLLALTGGKRGENR